MYDERTKHVHHTLNRKYTRNGDAWHGTTSFDVLQNEPAKD